LTIILPALPRCASAGVDPSGGLSEVQHQTLTLPRRANFKRTWEPWKRDNGRSNLGTKSMMPQFASFAIPRNFCDPEMPFVHSMSW